MRRFSVIIPVAMVITAQSACDSGPKFGPPAQLAKIGDDQTGVAGLAVEVAPAVVVTDDAGRGVPGVTVTFAVTTGDGSVMNATALTDAKGTASSGAWTLGTVAGPQSLRASAPDVPGSPASFVATATAGPMAALEKVGAEPTSSPAGGNIDSIGVRATDKFGNPVAGQEIVFTVTGGGGVVSPASRLTLADGRASARWTLGPAVEQANSVTAARPDGSLAVTFSTTSTHPVASIRFNDRVLVVDSAQTIMPSVVLSDASGNPVPGAMAALSTRNASVATAGASFATGTRSGQTFLIATSLDNPAARDSALLLVSGAEKPAVMVTVPRFDLRADTSFTVSIIVDSRSASVPIGAATLQVVWNPGSLTLVSETAGSAEAFVDVSAGTAASGVLTIAMASAAGLAGPAELRRLTFRASTVAGPAGALSVNVIDMAAAGTFANLATQTVSGSYPLRIR